MFPVFTPHFIPHLSDSLSSPAEAAQRSDDDVSPPQMTYVLLDIAVLELFPELNKVNTCQETEEEAVNV